METCKYCGADAEMQYGSKDESFRKYWCGTLKNACEWERSDRCHANQLAASEARARELWEALRHLIDTDAFSFDNACEVYDKHADHFGKESEVTNGR